MAGCPNGWQNSEKCYKTRTGRIIVNATNPQHVWVIGFPKSGNTWISYLCSYCLNLPFSNFGNPKESQQKSWIKELTRGGNDWSPMEGYSSVKKTHKYPDQVPFKDSLVIYVIRDPRDVFVSYHYFMRSTNARMLGRARYYLLGLLGKHQQIKWFLSKWMQHVQLWTPHSQVIVCYEKLLSNGSEYLNELLSVDPFFVDGTIVNQAYENFSFDKMSGGRKPGSEDQKSFFRKGISGDWQNHFSGEEAELFNRSLKIYQSSIR